MKNIAYEADKDPTRMVMEYPTVDPRDMRPLPPKRTEVCVCSSISSGRNYTDGV